MKKTTVLLFLIFSLLSLHAQDVPLVYTDASSLTLIGQAFPLTNSYYRIDTAAYPQLPPAVKKLLTNAAGLAISFTTTSNRIAAKWCVTKSKPAANMTPIANKGLDLYIKRNGKWQFAGVGRPDSVCNEYVMVKNMEKGEKQCLIYLPLYDELKRLEIGVDSGSIIQASPDPFAKKKVVIYGSSITQGASASRPGMAYPARLSRELDIHFINLGLSGNGKMEKEVADMVASVTADAFILDCFPNPTAEQITERTAYIVRAIRAKHPNAPIILIQSVVQDSGNFDLAIKEILRRKNENTLREYNKLLQEGVKNLHLIRSDNILGNDHESTVDGTHPNDIGFDRILQVITPKIQKILGR